MVTDRKILSPSRMMTFRKCPRNYEYDDLELFTPVTDGTALWFGKSVHKGIDTYYGSITENPTIAVIRSTVDQTFKQCWDSRISGKSKQKYGICQKNFENFEIWRLKKGENPFKPQIVEKDTFSEKFHARIDWFHHGRLIDWKTSRRADVTPSLQLELWVQAEVLKFAGYKVDSIQLFFLLFNKPVNLPPPNYSWLYKERMTIRSAIESNEFPPSVSILCHWCRYKLRCEYSSIKEKNYSQRKMGLWSDLKDSWNKKIVPQRITHEPEW